MCSASSLLFVSITGAERDGERAVGWEGVVVLNRCSDKRVHICRSDFCYDTVAAAAAKWKRAASLLRLKGNALRA